MENVPPPAEELAILDRELAHLDARRAQLLTRRAWLLHAMRPPTAAPPPGMRPFPAPVPETSPPNVQNLLLTLGGILLTIAAIAFTLVSWGHLGIGGRSAVLGAVTVATLAAPVALLRRKLASTAESLAALGLVLMVLDAYALHRVALPDTDGLGYAACAAAVLAALWAGYGAVLDRLHIPLPVAVLTAQLPLPLWALTGGAGAPSMEWALLTTAALDVVVALWTKPTAVRGIAATGAATTGGCALLIGGWQSVAADTPSAAAEPAVLLLTAVALALLAAWRSPPAAVAASAVAGLTAVAAVGGVIRAAVPEGWAVLGYLLCAVALLAVVRSGAPHRMVRGLTGAAGAVHAAAALLALPLVALTLLGPASQLDHLWSGTPSGARAALGTTLPETGLTATPVVLLVIAAVLTATSRRLASPATPTPGASAARPGPPDHLAGPDHTPPPGISLFGPATPTTAHTAAGPPGRPGRPARPADETSQPTPAPGTGSPWSTTPTTGYPGRTTPGHPAGPPPHVTAASTAAPTAPARGTGAPASLPARPVPGPDRSTVAGCAALALAWAALLVLPVALDLAHAAAITLHVLLTLTALAIAVRPPVQSPRSAVRLTALGCALAGAVSVALLSLATRPATFLVLGLLVAALTAAAVAARAPRTAPPVQAVLACAAVVFTTALLGAVARTSELPSHRASLVILAVPTAVSLLAARLRLHPVTLPLELTGATAGLLAVVLATGHLPTLALVLALLGVIAAAVALRPERRPVAGYLATALFVLATWVRLTVWDVESPEAYTLPVTVPALVVGVLRRRRDPEVSSWAAYGPGLAATLLPSLIAAWGDGHWPRPLLLGIAALAVTLVGARLRLQALLVLGGAVLALDALHELAPYVVQVVGALPRWLPPALAGVLLLAVGATYEQRLRDARKLRDTLGRMH